MAKHEYKRGFRVEKPCAHCGKVMILRPSTAAQKVFCSRECHTARVEQPCAECGKTLSLLRHDAGKELCCSLSCSSTLKARRKGLTIRLRHAFCVECGKEFRPNPRALTAGRFCSREHAYAFRSRTAEIARWIRSLGDENRLRAQQWRQANAPPVYVFQGPVRPISGHGSIGKCIQCRTQYVRTRERQRLCSPACEAVVAERVEQASKEARRDWRKTPKGRAHKKLYKTLRRRRELTVFEAIDPIAVFERDKWTCQICRVKTPRARRGTNEPNAPELDHIIPLAKGGSHTWINLQCACRRCNGAKGDRPMGQLLLAGIA